jgi:DNA-binding MarR family transcriptional regulator
MVEASRDGGAETGTTRSADNLVHDLITIANDLRRHIDSTLAELAYEDRRPVFAPLLSLVWQGGVPQGRLAEALGVSPQAASQTVGLAERAGFVTRVSNPDDGRSKLVVLTELGRAFVADGAAAITRGSSARAGSPASTSRSGGCEPG